MIKMRKLEKARKCDGRREIGRQEITVTAM
jgi:hypothetical protein